MASICNQAEINHAYYVNVPMTTKTLGNNDSCWMRCDASLPSSNLTDYERYWLSENESTIAGIMATFVSIPGTILNFLVILVLIRNKDLQKEYLTPSIASITLTDFVFSAYVISRKSLHFFKRDVTWFEGCNVLGFFGLGLWMVSIFNLIGIAGLRCFAINYPRKTKTTIFQHCCTIIPMMGWISTLTLFLPILTRQYGRLGMYCNNFLCGIIHVDAEENPISPGPRTIYFMIIVFSGILLLCLNILSYVQVSKQSQKVFDQIKCTNADEATKVLRNEKMMQRMVGRITAACFLVYGPTPIVLIVIPNLFYVYPMIGVICLCCSDLLVILDPFIYIYSSEKFRNGIKLILNPMFSRNCTLN